MTALYALPRRALIFVIELYRTWISPTRMPTCRFEPSCSTYAVEALDRHGFVAGSALSAWRLLKCGPWHKPGYDPVPERLFGRGESDDETSVPNGPPAEGERAMSDRGL